MKVALAKRIPWMLLWLFVLAPVAHADSMRMCAEWEPAFGTLIRYPLGIPASLVVELAEDDSLYVLAETQALENQASSAFAAWGVDLDHVHFIRADTYSHWTRDWGPHSVFDDEGIYGITDPYFDGYPWVAGCFMDGGVPRIDSPRSGRRGYEEDDAVNAVLADEFGCPLHEMPAYCTGGNIMTDGHGVAFSTRRMVNENAPLMSEEQFRAAAQEYLGITAYHFLDDPETHGIQHIDCYAKLLDEETVVVKEVYPSHPEYACIERLVDQIAAQTNCYGRPYRIVRVYCGSYSGHSVAAYTNSLILNRKVLVPTFGISSDAAALATYTEAMPGYEVIGVPYSAWYYYDALHCRTMGIFDRHMLRIWHRRLDDEVQLAPEYRIGALIDDRSEAGLIANQLCVYWRADGDWESLPLVAAAAPDSFYACIPGQAPGTVLDYYIAAADHSGRRETLPRTAPEGYYSFTITTDPAGAREQHNTGLTLEIHPTPLAGRAYFRVQVPRGEVRLTIHDPSGRRVRTLQAGALPTGEHNFTWNGRDDHGMACRAGLYLVTLVAEHEIRRGRCLLIR